MTRCVRAGDVSDISEVKKGEIGSNEINLLEERCSGRSE